MSNPDPSHSHSERELFFEALGKTSPEARSDFLDGACFNKPELRRRIEELLANHAEQDSFMQEDALDADLTTLESTPLSEGTGTVIGRYKLLQKVGEGGMGVVYMAEQTEPVTRKVALKIIKLGMDTKQVVARFEAERQALAMMDHPYIAKVLDAGATDTGRPYFVMELVRGVPITEYCDKNKLSTVERLRLFIPVCNAIQHAHQKGIIHRDIKPSNVMVTLNDGVPHPMVIDFGIAKATNQKLTEKTLFTNYAQMIGTPAYMSPEQAEMSKLDVDTRTDVYSLGVLLYELLTGTTPFPSKELMSMGYGEMQRIIAEKEPPKPSTRLSTMQNEDRTVVAKNRSMEVSALGKVFVGDLDWIVMKALEKDRTHRYETVNALVSDVKRHLDDEPVSAAAPTFSYQFRKFARRNKKYMRAAAVVAGLLVVASTIASYQAVKATQQKLKAERAEANAVAAMEQVQRETVRGDDIARFMIQVLEQSVPELLRQGRTSSARELMVQAETLATEGLAQAPAAEFRLRYILTEYYFSALNDFSLANVQGERLKQLLGMLADDEIRIPRVQALATVASVRLWNAPRTESGAQDAISEINQVVDLAASMPGASGYAGSSCLVNLAIWHSVRGDIERTDTALVSAMRQYANEPPSGMGNLIRETFFRIRSYGFKLPEAEPLLPEMPPLPKVPHPLYVDIFYKSLFQQCRFAQLKGTYGEILEILTTTEKKVRDAGWPRQHSVYLDLLNSWALSRTRNQFDVGPAVLAAGSDLQSNVRVWAAATTLAGSFADPAAYHQLRHDGIARFASTVEGEGALQFCSAVLLHPLSEDLIEIVNRVLERAERSSALHHYWMTLLGPTIRGALAVRTGEFETAIQELDDYEKMEFDSNFGAVGGQLREIAWGWRMTRAIALAQVGRDEDALSAFQEAVAVREKYIRINTDIYGFDDVWYREAEHILFEKGILNP